MAGNALPIIALAAGAFLLLKGKGGGGGKSSSDEPDSDDQDSGGETDEFVGDYDASELIELAGRPPEFRPSEAGQKIRISNFPIKDGTLSPPYLGTARPGAYDFQFSPNTLVAVLTFTGGGYESGDTLSASESTFVTGTVAVEDLALVNIYNPDITEPSGT